MEYRRRDGLGFEEREVWYVLATLLDLLLVVLRQGQAKQLHPSCVFLSPCG